MAKPKELSEIEPELQQAGAASDLYQLLSLSLHLPSEELAVGLLNGSFAEDLAAIFEELNFPAADIEKIKTGLAGLKGPENQKDELFTEMRREYTRLFAHPKNPAIAIYETTFRYDPADELASKPALFISPAALDAERCYKKAGLAMSGGLREPGDHIAVEMEFMMYLHLQKAQALTQNDPQAVARRDAEIKEFTEDHLKKWAKAFYDRCVYESQSSIYRIIGEIGSLYMAKVTPA